MNLGLSFSAICMGPTMDPQDGGRTRFNWDRSQKKKLLITGFAKLNNKHIVDKKGEDSLDLTEKTYTVMTPQ